MYRQGLEDGCEWPTQVSLFFSYSGEHNVRTKTNESNGASYAE